MNLEWKRIRDGHYVLRSTDKTDKTTYGELLLLARGTWRGSNNTRFVSHFKTLEIGMTVVRKSIQA